MGCELQYKSLARISFAIITKGFLKTTVTLNYFVIFLAGMVDAEGPPTLSPFILVGLDVVGLACEEELGFLPGGLLREEQDGTTTY